MDVDAVDKRFFNDQRFNVRATCSSVLLTFRARTKEGIPCSRLAWP